VLDEIALAEAIPPGGGQQLAYDVELMIAGEDLDLPLLARPLALPLSDLRVVLEDLAE
jgi:hypothetical protein